MHPSIQSCAVGMAWEARSGLKLIVLVFFPGRILIVGMAWEARSGLKPGGPKPKPSGTRVGMAWEARSGLKPGGIEGEACPTNSRNGLGSPFGFETDPRHNI